MANPPSEQGIPLLTEVIGSQSEAAPGQFKPSAAPASAAPVTAAESAANLPRATPVPVSPERAPSASAAAATPPQPAAMADNRLAASAAMPAKARTATIPAESIDSGSPAGTWSDTDLRDLENELRLRITRQVLGRVDFVLDHRVRNSVTEVVDAAIDTLAAEIKRGLHETLTDIVARAVAQEISRLQSGKK